MIKFLSNLLQESKLDFEKCQAIHFRMCVANGREATASASSKGKKQSQTANINMLFLYIPFYLHFNQWNHTVSCCLRQMAKLTKNKFFKKKKFPSPICQETEPGVNISHY